MTLLESAAAPPALQGGLNVMPPRQVSGWCLWPDRAGARVTVEILVDGRVVAAMVAAQRFGGAGDGRHGFALTLPVALAGPATSVVEARERGGGTVFGRVVLFAEQIAQPIEDRLAALDRSVLHAPIIGQSRQFYPGVREAFAGAGAVLMQRAVGEVRSERRRLARRAPRLALAERPALSVIVAAAPGVDRTLDVLAGLQPLCDAEAVEVLLADDGADPRTLLLAQVLPGVRYVRERGGLRGSLLNQLVADAQGATLCFLDQDPPGGAWAWPPFAETPRTIHVGGAVAAALSQAAAVGRPAPQGRGAQAVALQVERAVVHEAGGFDPALHGTLAYADMALKGSLLGAQVSLVGRRPGTVPHLF